MIVCVAVVGKKNELLFLETYVPEKDQQKFHFLAHSSLDIFDEKKARKASSSTSSSNSTSSSDMYLGHLCPMEEFRLYGYVTSTQIKFIVILNEGDIVRESELRSLFQGVHCLYVNYLQSPFSSLSGRIASDRFLKGVERQVTLYNQLSSTSTLTTMTQQQQQQSFSMTTSSSSVAGLSSSSLSLSQSVNN